MRCTNTTSAIQQRSLLNGILVQGQTGQYFRMEEVGARETTAAEKEDLLFANHRQTLKEQCDRFGKTGQLIGKGCGQTSRIDALRQSIDKAGHFRST